VQSTNKQPATLMAEFQLFSGQLSRILLAVAVKNVSSIDQSASLNWSRMTKSRKDGILLREGGSVRGGVLPRPTAGEGKTVVKCLRHQNHMPLESRYEDSD